MHTATDTYRTKKAKTGGGNIFRWVVWIAWLSFIVYFFVKAGGINDVNFLYRSEGFISILNPVIVYIYLSVVLLVFAITMIFGSRAFCKYLCWMAPFMIIGDKIRHIIKLPGLYIHPHSKNCIECGICSKNCPMDIDVKSMVKIENMYNSECIMCLNCVDACPKKAITTRKVQNENNDN